MVSWILVGILGGAVYWCWSNRKKDIPVEPKTESDIEREIIYKYRQKLAHECLEASEHFSRIAHSEKFKAEDVFESLYLYLNTDEQDLNYRSIYLKMLSELED